MPICKSDHYLFIISIKWMPLLFIYYCYINYIFEHELQKLFVKLITVLYYCYILCITYAYFVY